jgi:hypothetical protein
MPDNQPQTVPVSLTEREIYETTMAVKAACTPDRSEVLEPVIKKLDEARLQFAKERERRYHDSRPLHERKPDALNG